MIQITHKYPDDACKTIRFDMKDLPGVIGVENGQMKLSYKHRFHFDLPREYPQNLGKIHIVNETPLYHPRIVSVGTKACYTVNGEIDRVLIDIIYNILLRPETVRPPSLFKDADWGLDSSRMKWYIASDPQKIHDFLKAEWGKLQKTVSSRPTLEKKKVKIMD